MLLKCKTKHLIIYMFGLMIMSGCSDIRLKPKDPELLSLGQFAEQVTVHLLDLNPSTYQEYQADLADELAPSALAKLMAQGKCAKSAADAAQRAREADRTNQRCMTKVESPSFPAKTTANGLVPIEVTGNCIKSQNYVSKVSKFDVLYFVGTNIKTKRPIIASVEIKQF